MADKYETHRLDDGLVIQRYTLDAECKMTRRDDLRGCWEVEGTIYPTRQAAYQAAVKILDTPQPEGEVNP